MSWHNGTPHERGIIPGYHVWKASDDVLWSSFIYSMMVFAENYLQKHFLPVRSILFQNTDITNGSKPNKTPYTRLPRSFWSRSNVSKRALKFPAPKPEKLFR